MTRFALPLFVLLALTTASLADNWPSWRGPAQNGVSNAKNTPTTWSATENVLWKVALPGRGSSTPIVWEDNVVVTCGVNGKNTVLCFDRNGKQRWQVEVGAEVPGKHKKASGSNPSAVTDGNAVYAYFKSGDFAAIDFSGKVLWKHNVQEMYGENTLWWDLGTSPVLTKNAVVVTVMQTGPSYLAAFDRATGKVLWKESRDLGAPSEAAQSYSTPVVMNDNGKEIIVVLGADHVTAHDAASGKELWRVGGLNPTNHQYFRSIASAVVSDGIVVAPYARGATITAVKLGGSGDVTKSHVAWVKEGLGADVPTPAAINGRTWVCTDKGKVACLDIKTGKEIWTGQLEQNRNAYSASPILADGKIYLAREDGKVFVLAQDEFKVLGENTLEGEFVVATPVLADGRLYLRSNDNLFCIGKAK